MQHLRGTVCGPNSEAAVKLQSQ